MNPGPPGRLLSLLLFLLLTGCGDAAAPAARPLPDPDPESAARGRELFLGATPRTGCARCHGRKREGTKLGPPLDGIAAAYSTIVPEGEDVAGRFEKHLRDPARWPALRKHRETYFAPMPSYAHLGDREIRDLVAFLLSLR